MPVPLDRDWCISQSTRSIRRQGQTDRAGVVFLGLMVNLFSVNHHAQGFVPSRNVQGDFKVSHGISQAMPALTLSDDRHQSQPLYKRHLDRVATLCSLQ